MNLAKHPRLPLTFLPTPLEPLERLSAILGGPSLWVKRDDMTGLALGGNKARKLEYLLGAAKAEGATVVMTTAGAASNYLRMTAAAARKAGMRPILFMRGTGKEPIQGNLLINRILGAEMRFIDVTDPWSPRAREIMDEAAAELTRQGERVYVMAIQNTHAPLAALGYVNAALELYQQLLDIGTQATHIFAPTGSGVTQAGLILGAKLLHWPLKVVGIAGAPNTAEGHRRRIAEMVTAAGRLLDVEVEISPDEIIVEDRFAGVSYGAATPGVVQAIRLCGEQEGLLVDPVYSGKAMHGMLSWIAEGKLTARDQVVFLHTGGAPNLFTQAESLAADLAEYDAQANLSATPATVAGTL
jgi:1-aminocyclopropane-1-carboxylate deaminase/D-cysteine desulfhydrase-like pyridoxal-dependent ACC family enzyme